MIKNIAIGIVVVGLLIGAFIIMNDRDDGSNETTGENLTAYSVDEVAKHDSKGDCWTLIDGKVYDISDYINKHPGGSEIERACGTDGTSLFNQRQTVSGEDVGSGTPHSSSAKRDLIEYQIGVLDQQ